MGVSIALALLSVAIYLLYRWSTATYDYFEKRGVPFVKPFPLIGGMLTILSGSNSVVDCISQGYLRFRESRVSGLFMFRQPSYLIHDPELVKQITITDFDHFVDHFHRNGPVFGSFAVLYGWSSVEAGKIRVESGVHRK